ncbi:MAG: mannose-6-phosphate isomerase, class I, partial [Candidatus Omnitrophica bacterium]|nr:mannose-6-phosphate isomerase, class I [Candidatus Omnitrophota bacterium]
MNVGIKRGSNSTSIPEAASPPFWLASSLLLLQPTVQHYPWGDPDFIPRLIGQSNPEGKPFAELWMGAHPDSPSLVRLPGRTASLLEILEAAAEDLLQPAVAERFQRRLPFLLKILAAAAPLSLQIHPSRENAVAGYTRENLAGIPLHAPSRNYKDPNHKPELVVALTDFYGLSGFRPLPDIARQIAAVPALLEAMGRFESSPESLREHYSRLMEWPQSRVDGVLNPLIAQLTARHERQPYGKEDREYWLLRSDQACSIGGHRDRGLFSFYLLNLVHLRPGQGMYLPAGILHSYLEGAAIEIMANSNNVLRGGLTAKHIDVPELLRNVAFVGAEPEIINARRLGQSQEWFYPTPAEEFELHRIELSDMYSHVNRPDHSADILILFALDPGTKVSVTAGGDSLELSQGQVFMAPHGTAYTLRANGRATLYKATLPQRTPAPSGTVSIDSSPSFRGRRPTPLAFGTSGLRGLVADITDLEAYVNTRGFLDYLCASGDVKPGGKVSVAGDLRPSTNSPGRSILRAVARAIQDAGLEVDNLGELPTPALTYYAIRKDRPSIMVTGSHIPFDRNGIKFNRSSGEILKSDEPGILASVQRVRRAEYDRPRTLSLFADDGMFKKEHEHLLPPVNHEGRREYLRRYWDFFPPRALQGARICFYQHSAVGRDLLVELLAGLGAEVIPLGRSESFIPIDTEAIAIEQFEVLQALADQARREGRRVDAVISTDG